MVAYADIFVICEQLHVGRACVSSPWKLIGRGPVPDIMLEVGSSLG